MKKYYLTIIIVFLTTFGLLACSSKTKNDTINLVFSEYYKNADDYEKIQPLMVEYFSCIQNAYNKSDKLNLDTFTLPDEYKEASNSLAKISNDNSKALLNEKTNLSKEYLARLQLLEPYLRMEVFITEKDLLNNSNKDWFDKVNNFLESTYSEFENGTGN